MGMRLVLQLYKGGSEAAFRSYVEQAALNLGGQAPWGRPPAEPEEDFRFHSDGLHHAIYVARPSYPFLLEIGRLSQLPWIALRIQEGSLWDYTLHRGTEKVDDFSPWPEYWEDPNQPGFAKFKEERRGNPEVLASVWSVPVERIERYVKQWGEIADPDVKDLVHHELTGKAYPSDRSPYGSYEQFFDVLRALGGKEPFIDYEQHSLILPRKLKTVTGG
jgi:hypothetical protein